MTEELVPYPPETDSGAESEDKDAGFDRQAKKDFIASAKSHAHIRWRKEAAEDFDFVAGGAFDPNYPDGGSGQWHEADVANLKAQNRPIITMNRTEPLIEGIAGAEVNNRQEVSWEAREPDDKGPSQAMQEVGKWARDNDVEEEETDAFRNTLICGMGWTIHTFDYSEDLDGKYQVISSDPLGHFWDTDARRPNLSDARWVGYVEKMSRDRFESMFPGEKGGDNVFGIRINTERDGQPEKYNSDYDDPNLMDTEHGGTPPEVLVLEYQCYKMEPVWRVHDPLRDELSPPMEKQEFDDLKAMVESRGAVMARFGTPVDSPEGTDEEGNPLPAPPVFRFLQQEKRVYYRTFYSGNKRLGDVERCQWRNGFSMRCITGRRHRRRNTWYGVVRAMKDPQRLTNKFLSSMIHHYNSNPKGGVFYEEDAVDSPDEIESKLAAPAPAIRLRSGALSGGKIQPIQPAQMSAALDRLLQIVSDMPPLVTGVSLEWLGLAGRDQPVGLEQTRKLATLSIVAPVFSSYRKYKKEAGRLLFDYVKDYVPVSTLKRVLSQDVQEYIPALKRADTLKYDIHVDDAPLSPSVKATVFSSLKDVFQFGKDLIPPGAGPKVASAFFNYSPLPAALVREIDKALQPAPPDPMAIMFKLGELKKLLAEGEEKMSKADLNEAKAANEDQKPEQERRRLQMDAIDSVMNLLQTQMQTDAAMAKTSNGGSQ